MKIEVRSGKHIELAQGDITRERTDAIVNAANSSLMGGGGVDGAIHRAGGPGILRDCEDWVAAHGRLPSGGAMVTGGGKLAVRYVIHAVGPHYRDGQHDEPATLASAYQESMQRAQELKLESVSFPSISTGIYGYPVAEAARIALETVRQALARGQHVRTVRFVLFDQKTFDAYAEAARALPTQI